MLTAIVGINWGDEGKGRMVDLLSEHEDIVIRYQGGNNAGHTVVNDGGKFILNLLPSGILRPDVVCVMGNGMCIDLQHLDKEIASLRAQGIEISPKNLKISDRAVITMPYHVWQDGYEEERLGDKKFGSTKRGIAYVYGDKYMKTCIRIGDLLDEEYMAKRLADVIQLKSITLQKVYGKDEINYEEMLAWLKKYAEIFKDYIVDTGVYLRDAVKAGKRIMFEAQLGALRDIDFGIYPYTSSSSVIAAYAPIGAGIPGEKIDASIGIMKAYSTCVGEGPFTAELGMTEEEKDELRKAGGEYGAATGRPRRVGPFDVVASKYGCRVQGASEIALTKLDILSSMKKIPVVTAYDVDGTLVHDFPTGDALNRAKPVVEYLEGWNCDVSGCRKVEDLPKAALDYIRYIEKAVECKITYVSVGAEREAYVKM